MAVDTRHLILMLSILILSSCASHTRHTADIKTEDAGGVPFEEPPRYLHRVEPEFPPGAAAAGCYGEVWVSVFIDPTGKVTEAKIIQYNGEPGCGLVDAALKAAYASTWVPARSNGKPISVWVAYKVTFGVK